MRITVDVYHHWVGNDGTAGKLDHILSLLRDLKSQGASMSQAVDNLVALVTSQRTVIDSAKALLERLFALVQGAIDTGDLAKVQQALTDLQAQKDELATAVQANTPTP